MLDKIKLKKKTSEFLKRGLAFALRPKGFLVLI